MPSPLALPEGYHERALTLTDAGWQRPSYDLGASSVGVTELDGPWKTLRVT